VITMSILDPVKDSEVTVKNTLVEIEVVNGFRAGLHYILKTITLIKSHIHFSMINKKRLEKDMLTR